jgi:hypothetical protein
VQQNRGERANEIHQQCNDTPVRDFWSDHPVYGAFAITRPFRYADWGAHSWGGYGSADLPTTARTSISDVAHNGDHVATEEEYSAETLAMAPTRRADTNGCRWVPALTQEGEERRADTVPPSKQGVVSGRLRTRRPASRNPEGWPTKRASGPPGESRARRLIRDRDLEPDPGHQTGADSFCRWPDPAVVAGTAGGSPAVATIPQSTVRRLRRRMETTSRVLVTQ